MISYGFFSAMLAVFIEGALAYIIDRRFGVRVVYWWNRTTHEVAPRADEIKGLIYHRRAHVRLTMAIIITLIQNAILFVTGTIHPLLSIVSVPVELVALMAGFYAGPLCDRLWDRKKPILDVIDKLESGDTTITEELRHAAGSLRESLPHHLGRDKTEKVISQSSQIAGVTPVFTPEKKPEKTLAEKIEEDPLKYINDFTRGGGRDGSE